MKPNQVRLMTKPGTGNVFLVEEKPGQRPKPVKDVTDDFVLMQAAEILLADAAGIATLYCVKHPNGEVLEIEITAIITHQEKPA